MAPRGIMRLTDDSVASGLQPLIAKQREYMQLLLSIDKQLAQRLRFANAATACPIITEFLGYINQLLCFHTLYADKLQHIADTSASNADSVLEDMLLVTGVVYAELHVHRARFKAAIDSQLRRKTEDAAQILREFLQANSLTSQQLVALPLKHLEDLLERADITMESASVTATCEATKRFLDEAETHASQERQLIELQSQLRGSPLEMELYGRKLLCRCEVALSSSTSSSDERIGLVLDDEAAAAARPLHDVYCLDDGTVLFIEKADASGLCINLKNDAVFLEAVPSSLRAAKLTTALVLSGPSSSLQVTSSGAQFETFAGCVTTLLEQNETRTQQLKGGRTSDDLDLPSDLRALLKSPQKPLLVFPCFHDDELPGIFWLHDTVVIPPVWRFVELVQFGPWLLVFAISGWRKHRLIHRVDLTSISTTITETKRADDNWALVIETEADKAAAVRLDVVSERRARIDFWYDQVSKAIEAAAVERKKKTEEEEKRVAAAAAKAATESTGEKEPEAGGFIDARAKKRQRNTKTVEASTPTTETTDAEAPEPVAKPVGSAKKTRGSKASASVADAVAAAQDALEGKEAEDLPASAPTRPTTASSAAKRQRTPPVNTPKQRWVRRKVEDPDDDELEATQPGGSDAMSTTEEPAKEPEIADSASSDSIRIILTGIEATPKTFKKISAIPGAVYEENIEKATHVIAPKNTLKRTVKLLCGISCCDHILDERWLDESARVHTAVYERQYCLKDAKAESKWGFDLVKTMYDCSKASRRQLFQGYRFFIPPHKSVLPPVQDLVKIVEQAGGSVATSGAADALDIVITSETAMGTAAIQKLLARADPARVYTPELVLSSILQQRLDLTQHRLSSCAASSSASRSRNSTGSRR